MTHRFEQLLNSKTIIVGDGAMGTLLQAAGLERGACGESWNLEKPDAVVKIHQYYVDAGSDFILTNTFGGSPTKLSVYGLADRAETLNAAGVRLARKAAGDRCLVLGDLGPSGSILEPYGNAVFADLKQQYQRQIRGLLDGGVDGFIIETMMDINELRCAFDAARELSDLPIVTSMCFQEARGVYRTMFGTSAADAAQTMEAMGATVAAANCMVEIDKYIPLVKQMREGTSLPILAQPNAGQPRLVEEKAVYDAKPETMMAWIPELVKAGARLLGGCCGTTPDYIRLLQAWATEYNN